jgi:hypothetical protein
MAIPTTDTLTEILRELRRIAGAIERLSNDGKPVEPNFRRPISEFRNFDWDSIDASVVQSDKDGPTHVECGGALWMRRSPANKFAPAIWFSRACGKNAEGENEYLRLITFETPKVVDEMPGKVSQAAGPAEQPAPTDGKKEYLDWAQGKGLKPESATWILTSVYGEITRARQLVPIVVDAIAAGLDGKTIAMYFKTGEYDPEKCRKLIREIKK